MNLSEAQTSTKVGTKIRTCMQRNDGMKVEVDDVAVDSDAAYRYTEWLHSTMQIMLDNFIINESSIILNESVLQTHKEQNG